MALVHRFFVMTVEEQTLTIIIIIITLEGLIVLLYIGKIFCCNDIHWQTVKLC